MSFQGEFYNSIDPKGRASIPARFREILADAHGEERLFVTKNWDGGLSAYPVPLWEKNRQKVEELPPGPQRNAAFRLVVAPAVECSFDKQGRILIPEALRLHANLERDIVVVGMSDRIEIYSKDKHAEVTQTAVSFVQEDPQFMSDLGF
ncbi:MAG: division/cell wall cluster transcriptional repressor MraZ [Desulfuromonadales bacterium]|nr:division/cell wall cluster transcriptional repressor MraZ [Desulfuromonadales bacterium]MDW7756380.1 division/cell wall cluster transcriptional repressor MraZ [Desulfuromonadales bacterium]